MVWGALIGGGLSLAGTLASSAMRASGQRDANAANIAIAQANREFQERSYKHRYQWQLEDMRKAGLNPMLSARLGAGDALHGSVIPVQNVYGQFEAGVGDAVKSAVDIYRADTEKEKVTQEVAKMGQEMVRIGEEVKKIRADTAVSQQERVNREAELRRIFADTVVKNAQGVLTSEQIKLVQSQVAINKWVEIIEQVQSEMAQAHLPRAEADEAFYSTAMGRFFRWIERAKDALNPFGGSGIGAPYFRR